MDWAASLKEKGLGSCRLGTGDHILKEGKTEKGLNDGLSREVPTEVGCCHKS